MAKKKLLHATLRKRSGSSLLKAMRREGLIPAVIYGKAQDNQNIKVEAREFSALLHQSASENILLNLDIEGEKQLAIIQDVQHDALAGTILHADFRAINEKERIHATLPVEAKGNAPGVKAGGMLDVQVRNIEVHCLPKDLPEMLTIDVSSLEIGDAFHVSEIPFPEGVEPTLDGQVVVAMVAPPRIAEEEEAEAIAAAAAAEDAEPEVLREKKPDEEGEAADEEKEKEKKD